MEAPTLHPPKVSELGHQPFGSREQEQLVQWLHEPTWPRGTLDIHALAGYLTALLVWPVESHPGAWLPPIWNESGWKLPPPIDTAQRYGEFLELVLGLLRITEQRLLQSSASFEPDMRLHFEHDFLDIETRAQHWAEGFGRGLKQGAQSRFAPDLDAREAVRTIAAYAARTSRLPTSRAHEAHSDLTEAVLVLAKSRVSRGPLGRLPKQTAVAKS